MQDAMSPHGVHRGAVGAACSLAVSHAQPDWELGVWVWGLLA
jgi:hypothetical protein